MGVIDERLQSQKGPTAPKSETLFVNTIKDSRGLTNWIVILVEDSRP